jgi:hypothetical protein
MRNQPDTGDDRLLTQQELAVRWQCSLRKLQRQRTTDSGPVFVRLGGSIRYLLADILAFENQNRIRGKKP